jgi:hypothetical protein
MLGVTIVGWKQRDLAMERLAARFGPRLFMSLGPAIMALGLGWLARIPADSQAWVLVAASVDTSSHQFRTAVAPLNQPPEDVSPQLRAATTQASTEAFHLAMLVAAGLMLAGAAVNALGIRNPAPAGRHLGPAAEQPPPESGAGTPRRLIPRGVGMWRGCP